MDSRLTCLHWRVFLFKESNSQENQRANTHDFGSATALQQRGLDRRYLAASLWWTWKANSARWTPCVRNSWVRQT